MHTVWPLTTTLPAIECGVCCRMITSTHRRVLVEIRKSHADLSQQGKLLATDISAHKSQRQTVRISIEYTITQMHVIYAIVRPEHYFYFLCFI
jgi:hypothetical protein